MQNQTHRVAKELLAKIKGLYSAEGEEPVDQLAIEVIDETIQAAKDSGYVKGYADGEQRNMTSPATLI